MQMGKRVKFVDNTYLDASSVIYNGALLSTIFNNNMQSPEGYVEIVGGIMIQWGIASGTGYKTFPKPFNNGCLCVISDGVWNPNSSPAYKTLSGVSDWDKIGFYLGTFGFIYVGEYQESIYTQSYRSINSSAGFSGTTRWVAIGY